MNLQPPCWFCTLSCLIPISEDCSENAVFVQEMQWRSLDISKVFPENRSWGWIEGWRSIGMDTSYWQGDYAGSLEIDLNKQIFFFDFITKLIFRFEHRDICWPRLMWFRLRNSQVHTPIVTTPYLTWKTNKNILQPVLVYPCYPFLGTGNNRCPGVILLNLTATLNTTE